MFGRPHNIAPGGDASLIAHRAPPVFPSASSSPSDSDSDEGEGHPRKLARSQLTNYDTPQPWSPKPSSPLPPDLLVGMENYPSPVVDLTHLAMTVLRYPYQASGVAGPAMSAPWRPDRVAKWEALDEEERRGQWQACVNRVSPGGYVVPDANRRPTPLDVVAFATCIEPPTIVIEGDAVYVVTRFRCAGDEDNVEWSVETRRRLKAPPVRTMPIITFRPPKRALPEEPPERKAAEERPTKRAAIEALQPPAATPQLALRCPERVVPLVDQAGRDHLLVLSPLFYALLDTTMCAFESNTVEYQVKQHPLAPPREFKLTERVRFYTLLRAMVASGSPITLGDIGHRFLLADAKESTDDRNRMCHYYAACNFLKLFLVPVGDGSGGPEALLAYSPWLAFSLLDATTEPALQQWFEAHKLNVQYFPYARVGKPRAKPRPKVGQPKQPQRFNIGKLFATTSASTSPAVSTTITAPLAAAAAAAAEELVVVDAATVLTATVAVPLATLPPGASDARHVNRAAIAALLLPESPVQNAEFRLLHGAKLYDMTHPCTRLDMEAVASAYLTWFLQLTTDGYAELPVLFWYYVFQLVVTCFYEPTREPDFSDYHPGVYLMARR